MNPLSLTPRQRHQLEHQLHSTPDARLYRRTLAILEISRGRSNPGCPSSFRLLLGSCLCRNPPSIDLDGLGSSCCGFPNAPRS
jgi:hypothetical protein